MNRIATSSLLALALLAAAASLATAAVPSPVNSTLPACMVLCPLGDIPFTVIVRDLANNPVAGSSVVISFEGCPNSVHVCPQLPSDPYDVNPALPSLRMFADASGSVTFPARVGGTGPAGCAAVFADGVLMRNYALASPDQDGDGLTSNLLNTDHLIFNAKLGTADPTADMDCSGGVVDGADQVIYFLHGAQSCLGFIDAVHRRTWGSVKSHYR